jgi:hypothetical protein
MAWVMAAEPDPVRREVNFPAVRRLKSKVRAGERHPSRLWVSPLLSGTIDPSGREQRLAHWLLGASLRHTRCAVLDMLPQVDGKYLTHPAAQAI